MILLPLVLYGNQLIVGYKDDSKISLAKNTVKKLGESVDWVYSQGSPAKLSVQIYVPDDIYNISLNNRTILFRIKTSAGITDVYYITIANLTGSIPTNSGYYIMTLTAHENYVNISW
jgi:hypothetical protein